LRQLAKLILNSLWGKFGQRENQTKTKILNSSEELFDLLTDPAIIVNTLTPVNEETLVCNYERRDEASVSLATVNVCIAANTTAQARLKLYSYPDRLTNRVSIFRNGHQHSFESSPSPSPDLFEEIPDDGEMPNWMPPPEIVVSSEGIAGVGEDDDIIIID
ncbi:DNA/RNA polymerase superfamily, partial [Gonioctena quinquepunctata]